MIKDLWEFMTFQTHYGPLSTQGVVVDVILRVLVLATLVMIGAIVAWVAYAAYRVIAYDYEEVTLRAKVTDKEFEEGHYVWRGKIMAYCPDEYDVHISTIKYGLDGIIDDEELYNWARKGARLSVTMKIGWSRSQEPEIKCWRVTEYSWR